MKLPLPPAWCRLWDAHRDEVPRRRPAGPRPPRGANARLGPHRGVAAGASDAIDAALAATLAPDAASGTEADSGHPGCGWFDSSHDLACGLQVTEVEQPDEVAQLVPLRWWLAWELDAATPSIR